MADEKNYSTAPKPADPQRELDGLQFNDDSASRSAVVRAASKLAGTTGAPWLLQQFFNDQVNLSTELASRFPAIPLMSVIRFRQVVNARVPRGVATLTTADGIASLSIEADPAGGIQLAYSYGSMLALRFRLDELSNMDRARWLELMRRKQGGVAFLWGHSRWEKDYAICITRRHYANFYAFSYHGYEAAARMTRDVTTQLLDWLEKCWPAEPPAATPPNLLTW